VSHGARRAKQAQLA